jgi:predicted transposase YdaD
MLYRNKKRLLSLFNAVNGTQYDNPDDLTITTLEGVLYLGMKNDVSCIIDMMMQLYEHQSTVNPNMPLRNLFYVSDLLQKYIYEEGIDIYSRKQIKIPTPKFVVFYNGDEEQPERKEIRLSKAFSANTGETNMELVVLQININKGQNEELKAACKTLQEYAEFTERAREHRKEMELEDAIRTTIDECIRDGILKDFLLKNKAEVYHMCLYEFDVELHERVLREEEREEGRLEGIREGRLAGQQEGMQNGKKFAKQVFKAFMSGKTPETIAEELNVPLEEVKNLVD